MELTSKDVLNQKFKELENSADLKNILPEVFELFGSINYFEIPKPINLLKNLLKLATKTDDIVKMLKMSVFNKNIFTQNAKEIDIVYEVGLKNGFSLSAKNEIIKNEKYSFIKLYEENREFYFCFVDKIGTDIVSFIPNSAKLICYDKALDDSTKLNLREKIDLETL